MINWLLDNWFKKYWTTLKNTLSELKENDHILIDQIAEMKEVELKHYKELRQRIEDTNAIVRTNSEQLKEIYLMISEFYNKFKENERINREPMGKKG